MSTIKVIQKKNYITKDGTAPIYIYFYTQKKKIEIPTKVSCQVENFDAASGKITKEEKGYKDNNIMVKFRLNDKVMTNYFLVI